jgi:hypothetical protein
MIKCCCVIERSNIKMPNRLTCTIAYLTSNTKPKLDKLQEIKCILSCQIQLYSTKINLQLVTIIGPQALRSLSSTINAQSDVLSVFSKIANKILSHRCALHANSIKTL